MATEVATPTAPRLVRIEWLRGGTRSFIDVEPDATKGAMVGRDLYDQAGNLIQDLGVYVGQAIVARDVRYLNGYPVEKVITPQGTLIVRKIDTAAVLSGSITLSAGTQTLMMGPNIGAISDLLMWYGPSSPPGGMLKTNALFWIDTVGAAYFGGGVALEVAGSGHKLGDQRNNHPVTIGSIRSYWDGQTITYTVPTTGTVVTINVSAATLRMGSIAVAYSAGSANVTQARSTAKTWYLYYLDAGYAGGAFTLNATDDPNNLANSDSVLWVGKVLVNSPPSGTSGSGGGNSGGGGGGVIQ